jgi:hypothetical protein
VNSLEMAPFVNAGSESADADCSGIITIIVVPDWTGGFEGRNWGVLGSFGEFWGVLGNLINGAVPIRLSLELAPELPESLAVASAFCPSGNLSEYSDLCLNLHAQPNHRRN